MKLRTLLAGGLLPCWLSMVAVDAFAVTFHEISFAGIIRDGAEVANAGHIEQYLFGIHNTTNGINAIAQSLPDVQGGGTGISRFNATFSYREGTDGSLSLQSIDVGLQSTAYVYDLSVGPQGQLDTSRAQDIWRITMDHEGEVLSTSANNGQYIASISTGVGETVGRVESLNTQFLGIPHPGEFQVHLMADDPASMTVRSGQAFFGFANLASALAVLDNLQLSLVWDGLYGNPICGSLCGSGTFITWGVGSSTGILDVRSGPGSTEVPEPASAVLLGAGLLGLHRRRRLAQKLQIAG